MRRGGGTAPNPILVTGAGGFIGSHLAADLASRGDRVLALDLRLDRLRHLAAPGRLELVEGDVADAALLERLLDSVDTVYHLAAAHLGVSVSDEEYRRVNVEALSDLAEVARRAGIRRFVHCSSVGVYGRLRQTPADEETPCHPELVYERTKLEGEAVVLGAIDRGLPAVILRPVWVYGPGCPRTEKLFRAVRKGRFVVAGSGANLRHCLYIDDMLRALRLAATAEAAVGQVMIVGDDAAVTVRELVNKIARLLGVSPPRSVPLPLLYLLALGTEAAFRPLGKEPPVSRRSLKFFTGNTSFDTSRARRLLGFAPIHDPDSGLAESHRRLNRDPAWRPELRERSR